MTTKYKNEKLEPVFRLVLPELEKAGREYWVFGEFHRVNKDVDIFVKEPDFQSARLVLESVCQSHGLKYGATTDDKTKREKFEIFHNNSKKDVFSMIPVYQEDGQVIFRYPNGFGGNQSFPIDIFERKERSILGYRFFTPKDEYVKRLFIEHMKTRPREKLMMRPEYREDAKLLLGPAEIKEIENYYSNVGM